MSDRPRLSPTTVPRHRPPYREGVTGDGGQIVSTVPRGTVGDGGGRSEETPTVGSTDAMITERRAQREAATARRRALRALQRAQLNEARQYGLRARHAARETP